MDTPEVFPNDLYPMLNMYDIINTMERSTAVESRALHFAGGIMSRKRPSIPIGRTDSLDIEGIHAMGPLEAEVMEVVWRLGTAKVVDVVKVLRPRKEYQTVMTIMSNLAKKGLLHQNRSQKTYEYTPLMTKEEYEVLTVSKALDNLFEGYPEAVRKYMERKTATSMFGIGAASEEVNRRARSTTRGRTDSAPSSITPEDNGASSKPNRDD